LIELLTGREADGSSILAERLNALEFPGYYFAGNYHQRIHRDQSNLIPVASSNLLQEFRGWRS
jgi:hypothetical protein